MNEKKPRKEEKSRGIRHQAPSIHPSSLSISTSTTTPLPLLLLLRHPPTNTLLILPLLLLDRSGMTARMRAATPRRVFAAKEETAVCAVEVGDRTHLFRDVRVCKEYVWVCVCVCVCETAGLECRIESEGEGRGEEKI